MRDARLLAVGLALCGAALLGACGGDKKEAAEPDPVEEVVEPEPDPGEGMVEPEILEAIQRTFERKQTVVGRCFVEGIDAGEMKKTDRGFVTIGATINTSGKAEKVRILKSSLTSKALQACVVDLVESWLFEEPSVPVETSFMYTMERL